MNPMSLLQILGGLSIFIFGMKIMSDGLRRAAGEKMRSLLRMFSANRFIAVTTGAVVTGIIQSSSASTVMVVGFVNAGLLTLVQAIGLMLGAHIGTTITAQLVAFDISWIIMPAIIFGLLLGFVKKGRFSDWSDIVIGLGFIFLGMEFMSSELNALKESEAFLNALRTFECTPVNGAIPVMPMLGALAIGTLATCIMQSSSACTGVLVALGTTGLLDLHTAMVLVLGANIGTTITAQLAALTANRIAKQAALANTLSNAIGALIILASFWIAVDGEPVFMRIVRWCSMGAGTPRQIANAHTIFNAFNTMMWLPFIGHLAKLCEKLISVNETQVNYEWLDSNLLNTPSIALTQTTSAIRQMLKKSWTMIDCALNVYDHNDERNQIVEKQLEQREEDIDARQKAITEYLSKLMLRPLNEKESNQIPMLLHCTNDVERIGDHAQVIHSAVRRLLDGELRFSPEAEHEYVKLHNALSQLNQATVQMLEVPSSEHQTAATRMQERIKNMLDTSEAEHMQRIVDGKCRPQVGLLFWELLEEFRKISRHLENIHERAAMFYGKFHSVREEQPQEQRQA